VRREEGEREKKEREKKKQGREEVSVRALAATRREKKGEKKMLFEGKNSLLPS
jgi:hypothetical protein